MNRSILNTKVQTFIKNFKEDISNLAFTGSPFNDVATSELIQQIESYRKAKDKLPIWHDSNDIYYPPKLNLEQTSSQTSAAYKASIVSGKTLADITGGFGVDSYFFSEKFERVYHFEHNSSLSNIAAHNFQSLSKKNIECIAADGLNQVVKAHYDVIYADPSRRHDSKGKVFFLKDCEPNIPKYLSALFNSSNALLVKTSPMLDITEGLKELIGVNEIHIVAVNNEVKELLWLFQGGHKEFPSIHTINILKNSSEKFVFQWNDNANIVYGLPESFLYEPNAAIMKSGGFKALSEAYKVKKLHKHSHLFTGNILQDFPGRRFKIEKIIPYTKKDMRAGITFDKANVATRNFPESVITIRKKWKIRDGGDIFVFFTTLENDNKTMLICTKI